MMLRAVVVLGLVLFYAIHPLLGLTALAGVVALSLKTRKTAPVRNR
jgi:hypothetical protein